MLNILRTFQLGFHRFFSLYLCSAWNRQDRDASTAPTAQNAPDMRESCSRAATLPPALREGSSTRDTASGGTEVTPALRSRGGHYHKSPNESCMIFFFKNIDIPFLRIDTVSPNKISRYSRVSIFSYTPNSLF